jgi:hypothetical protein
MVIESSRASPSRLGSAIESSFFATTTARRLPRPMSAITSSRVLAASPLKKRVQWASPISSGLALSERSACTSSSSPTSADSASCIVFR